MYEKITGVPAPIKKADYRPDPELHQKAMQQLVEAAGHSLAGKATAYISTFATAERLSRPAITPEQVIAALTAANGVKSEAAKNLKISRQALYRILAKCGPSQDSSSGDSAAANPRPIGAFLDDPSMNEPANACCDNSVPGQLSLLDDRSS
jgi:hypothetical protein